MEHVFNLSQSGDETHIRLSGDLTVRNANRIASNLKDIPGRNVIIELDNPSALDLSFIQILVNFMHTLSQRGVKLQIKPHLNENDLRLIMNTGFGQIMQINNN